MKAHIYTLPHGIQVIGEYAPNSVTPYWRVRIRPHPFFSALNVGGGLYVRRSRVVLSSVLGRKLERNEHVHHKNHDRSDDRPENLELVDAFKHLSRHKTGVGHRDDVKRRIGASLRRAYAEGRRASPRHRDQDGENNAMAKLTRSKVDEIRASTETQTAIAARYGVSRRTIGLIKNGVTWK